VAYLQWLFGVSQQQINQIRRFFSTIQTPDSVITPSQFRIGIDHFFAAKIPYSPAPSPTQIVMGNLLTRSNIRKSPHLQRVVIRRIRFIAMIDESQVAPNVESISLI
jgi:hypothetical protein